MSTQTPAPQPAPAGNGADAPGGPGGDGGASAPPRASASPAAVRPMGAGIPTEKARDFRNSSRRLLALLREDRVPVWWIVALATVGVALTVVGPRILGHATDLVIRGLLSPSGIDFAELHLVLLGALALFLGSSGLTYVSAWLMAGIIQRTMWRMRAAVEDKLHRLPLSYVDRQQRGDLLSRVTNDIDNIAQSLQQTLNQLVSQALTLIGVLSMMVWISPVLALVAIVSVPISLLTMRGIASRSKARFIAQWHHTGELNAQVEEAFTGHAIVKAFGRQREVEQRFRDTNAELHAASFGAQFISGVIQPAMMFLGNLNYVVIAVIGGLRVTSGALTIGDVQAFLQYTRQFQMPLTQMAAMVNLLQSGVASAERVFELLDADEERPDAGAEPIAGPPRGRVAFEHVSFSYQPDRPLITDLSLVAEPGQTVAIVGPTGAGKTTLVNLLMRFYELDAGRITLDGHDIAGMPRRDLRAATGMVLQDTWLFGGTIRDNIAYGDPGATGDEIMAAARAAYVDRFAHSLPEGFETVLDDEGTNLSAGERQLVTIARAFLADPAILILDEATSSVDTRTEVLIQEAMAALRSRRTSFVIAHRLSTIRDADVILVMEHGSIVEQGHHDDLLARHGAYARLYQAQFAAAAVDLDGVSPA